MKRFRTAECVCANVRACVRVAARLRLKKVMTTTVMTTTKTTIWRKAVDDVNDFLEVTPIETRGKTTTMTTTKTTTTTKTLTSWGLTIRYVRER